jgi:flagellar biosynthesis/type III secretory pathway protein FliH
MSTNSVSVATDIQAAEARPLWAQVGVPDDPSVVRALLPVDSIDLAHRNHSRPFLLPSVSAERVAFVEREAYERGFAQGEDAGREAARVRSEVMLARLRSTVDEIAGLRVALLKQSERDVVQLSLGIAEHILHHAVRAEPGLLLEMARAAIRKLGEAPIVSILMHPDDFAAAAPGVGTLDGPISIAPDNHMPSGGCLVKSSFGTIDASVAAQIREVLRALLGDDAARKDQE